MPRKLWIAKARAVHFDNQCVGAISIVRRHLHELAAPALSAHRRRQPAWAAALPVAITLVASLHLVSRAQARHDSIVTRAWWLWLVLCFIALPFTARADGIDLPILISYGVGIFLPLLLFNATVEAPIMGRFLGIKFSELWTSWFKANVWSLLAGIPALILTEALTGWFLPAELGRRVRAYPLFLVLFIFVFFAATCLAEFLYARRVVRKAGVQVRRSAMVRGVLLANLASYAILGPVYFFVEYPRTDIREFMPDTRWAKEPKLTVVAIGAGGRLKSASADGQNHQVVVPYEVRDYVVSADLVQVLYRGAGDRFYFFMGGTNLPVPELGFWCRAPEMDFSPTGKYAAFFERDTHQIRVFEFRTGQFKDVPTFGEGYDCSLFWSSQEDTLYLRSGKACWEIVLEPVVAYRSLTNPPGDFANHYGLVGNSWSRDGVRYANHEDGTLKLAVPYGWDNHLVVYNQKETVMRLKDPAGQLGVEQAIFLESGEVLVGVGDFVYILDVPSKRIGPVMGGQEFIALAKPFSKQIDF